MKILIKRNVTASSTEMRPMTRSYFTYCKRYASNIRNEIEEFQDIIDHEDHESFMLSDSDEAVLDEAADVLGLYSKRK